MCTAEESRASLIILIFSWHKLEVLYLLSSYVNFLDFNLTDVKNFKGMVHYAAGFCF